MARVTQVVKKELLDDSFSTTDDPHIYHAERDMPTTFYLDLLDKAEAENLGLDDNIVYPSGGMVLLFNLNRYTTNGRTSLNMDRIRRSLRVDGYRWANSCGTRRVGDKTKQAYRSYNCLYNVEDPKKFDPRFKRKEYWYEGGSVVLFHYIGDDEVAREVAQSVPHGNSKKNTKPYVRTDPIVFVEAREAFESGRRLDEAYAASIAKGRDPLRTARNLKQISAVKERLDREKKRKATSFFNMHTLHELLRFEGTRHSFIHEVEMIEGIVFLLCEPLVEEFINTANLESESMEDGAHKQTHVLFYENGFHSCGFAINVLSFRHSVFQDDPPVPIAFVLAEKIRRRDDSRLFEHLLGCFPKLKSIPIVLCSSVPLLLDHIWPEVRFVLAVSDLKAELRRELTAKLRGQVEAIKSILAAFSHLISVETKEEFEERWNEMQENMDDEEASAVVAAKAEEWKEQCSPWQLAELGISSGSAATTRVPIRLFEFIIGAAHEAKVWVDGLAGSLFYLCQHMINEMEKGYYKLGSLAVKTRWRSLTDEPEAMPSQPFAPFPDEIVPFVADVALNSTLSNAKKRRLLCQSIIAVPE